MLRKILCGLAAAVALLYAAPSSAVVLQEGWWYNREQSGRGWAVSYRDYTKVFIGGFFYDDAGAPAWVISSMTQTASSWQTVTTPTGTTTVFSYTLEGEVVSCANGGPLAAATPKAPDCVPIGRATLQTDNPRRARLTIDRTGADRVVIDLVPFSDY